jgi:hypothetical protein
MTLPIAALDVDLHVLLRRMAVDVLKSASLHTSSPSDRIAYAIDTWLIEHPDTPVSTAADYPGWTPTTKEKTS